MWTQGSWYSQEEALFVCHQVFLAGICPHVVIKSPLVMACLGKESSLRSPLLWLAQSLLIFSGKKKSVMCSVHNSSCLPLPCSPCSPELGHVSEDVFRTFSFHSCSVSHYVLVSSWYAYQCSINIITSSNNNYGKYCLYFFKSLLKCRIFMIFLRSFFLPFQWFLLFLMSGIS